MKRKGNKYALWVGLFAVISLCLLLQLKEVTAKTNLIIGGISDTLIAGMGNDWFGEELNVKLVHVTNFMHLPPMLVAGKIDIMEAYPAPNFWNMILEGADFKIISGAAQCVAAEGNEPARNVRGFVVRKDLYEKGVIREVKDLVGKKVATFAPAPRKGEISPFPVGHKIFGKLYGEIEWVHIPKNLDCLAALESGEVVAARVSAPWFNIAVKKGIGVELFKETDYFPKMQGNVLVARDKFLKENREVVVRFLRAHQKALKYVTEVQHGQHRGEYEAFAKKYAPFPEAVSLEMIDAYKHTADIDINDLTIMQDHFVMTGSQKKFVPFDQVIDLSYLKEAKKK